MSHQSHSQQPELRDRELFHKEPQTLLQRTAGIHAGLPLWPQTLAGWQQPATRWSYCQHSTRQERALGLAVSV